jgi:hypothetical protein
MNDGTHLLVWIASPEAPFRSLRGMIWSWIMSNKALMMICTFLCGIVISGAGMLIRGDALGRRAAEEVEERVKEQIDEEIQHIRDLMETQNRMLQRMEEKLDIIYTRGGP